MRHLKIFFLSVFAFCAFSVVFSPKAFARDMCGIESTPNGVELKYYYYMSVGMNYCGNDYMSKYQVYRKTQVAAHGTLHKKAEAYFSEKLASSSCRSQVGNVDGRGEQGAIDKWITSISNEYVNQAAANTSGYCELASKYLNERMSGRISARTNVPARATVAKEQMQLAEAKIEPRPQATEVTYSSSSSRSHTGGSLLMPTSLAYTNLYQNLLPQGFNPASFGMMMPQMVFVPGRGYVPLNQPAMNPFLTPQFGVY